MVVTIWIFDALGESVHVVNTFKKLRCKQHISKFKGNSVFIWVNTFFISFLGQHIYWAPIMCGRHGAYCWEEKGKVSAQMKLTFNGERDKK